MKIICAIILIGSCVGAILAAAAGSAAFPADLFTTTISQKLATSALQSSIDIDGNQVYSPLGIASILAILAEASSDATYEEFADKLGYPSDRMKLRAIFQNTLQKYQNREYTSEPSFQTWFYAYCNHTIQEDFRQLLTNSYYVNAKNLKCSHLDDIDSGNLNDISESTTLSSNSKDVADFETLKRLNLNDDDVISDQADEQKDTYGEEFIDKPASKFDRVVNDTQYVDKPIILAEIQANEKKDVSNLEKQTSDIKLSETMTEQLDTDTDNELTDSQEKTAIKEMAYALKGKPKKTYLKKSTFVDSNAPEKISLPILELQDTLEKTANEDRLVRRILGARSLFRMDDIASALSASSLTGKEPDSKAKMILFNGLYYRGNWAHSLRGLENGDEQFFITAEDIVKLPMLRSEGIYKITELDHLKARAIFLPYENQKYGMLIVMPKEVEGLRNLIQNLQSNDIDGIHKQSQEKKVKIAIPKFKVEETSRSGAMLNSLGIKKIFTQDADFSNLSDDKNIRIDEVVQFVNIRVGESTTLAKKLNTENAEESPSAEDFIVDRPFLYFLMDSRDNFVIASGKICVPEFKDDPEIHVEIELD